MSKLFVNVITSRQSVNTSIGEFRPFRRVHGDALDMEIRMK